MNTKSVGKLLKGDFNPLQKFETYLKEEGNHGKGASEKTIKNYLKDMRLFEQYIINTGGSLEQLTRVDVQNYMNHLKQENKNIATIKRYFSSIKQFCKAMDNETATNKVRVPSVQKTSAIGFNTLSKTQLNGVLRASLLTTKKKRNKSDIRATAIVYLLAYTGIRLEECANLNLKDVELKKNGKITVLGKGNKIRQVPLPSDARDYLEEYLNTREDNEQALFVSNYQKRMDVRSIQRIVKKIGEIYNIGKKEEDKLDLHPHIFRHSFCRMLIKELGMDIVTVSQLMGHSSIEITRQYAMDSMEDISSKLDDFTI